MFNMKKIIIILLTFLTAMLLLIFVTKKNLPEIYGTWIADGTQIQYVIGYENNEKILIFEEM